MASPRPKAAELVALLPSLPSLASELRGWEAQAHALDRLIRDRRSLVGELEMVDEVVGGVPLHWYGDTRVEPVGSDLEWTRKAQIVPVIPDDYEGDTLDAAGDVVWGGPWLLYLDGVGPNRPIPWKEYPTREAAEKAAKRYAATGAVPGPPDPLLASEASNEQD